LIVSTFEIDVDQYRIVVPSGNLDVTSCVEIHRQALPRRYLKFFMDVCRLSRHAQRRKHQNV